MVKSELLRTTAVSHILQVSSDTIRLWANTGKLPVRKTADGARLFDRADVERLARDRERRVHRDGP